MDVNNEDQDAIHLGAAATLFTQQTASTADSSRLQQSQLQNLLQLKTKKEISDASMKAASDKSPLSANVSMNKESPNTPE